VVKQRAKREARKEFEAACISHLDALYASALKLTRSASDAEELVQDTFVKAFKFQHKFEWGTNLKAWLFRIQTNTFINDYRRKGHERRYVERAATESIYDEVLNAEAQAYAANPETHAFNKFMVEEIEHALEDLPDDFRLVVVLADLQGFSYKEVAEIIGCPIGTVMSRLHRGRRLLQHALIDYAVDAGVITPRGVDKGSATDLEAFRRKQKVKTP
jgi:RNA polymerase sigma-70 factor (ECF subfamily)